MASLVLSFLLLVGAGSLAAQQKLDVAFVRPPKDLPVFDTVAVEVRVAGAERVERVELWVDGRRAGEVSAPPYRFVVDVGDENREHTFRAVAAGSDGGQGEAILVTPAVHLDEVVELALQQLYVTVTDSRGQRALGLPREAFTIEDDGVPQELVTFASGEIPFTATLLVDASGSMRGQALEVALGGARAFTEGMTEDDEVNVVLHDDRRRWASGFQQIGVGEGLLDGEAGGGTAVLDQLFRALLELEQRQGRRVVVLLSDGLDVHSTIQPGEVETLARLSQALVYWVRLAPASRSMSPLGRSSWSIQVPMSAWRDLRGFRRVGRTLDRVVRGSGGRISEVASLGEVAPVFRGILRELREQYALGYYPDPRRNDGAWREVRLSVATPGLRLRAREGYVDH